MISMRGQVFKEDLAFPISKLNQGIKVLEALAAKNSDWDCFLFGHFADGNIHINMVPHDEQPSNTREQLKEELYRSIRQLSAGISAEHGVGRIKTPFVHQFMPAAAYDYFKSLKSSLDPNGILNPGVFV